MIMIMLLFVIADICILFVQVRAWAAGKTGTWLTASLITVLMTVTVHTEMMWT